DISSTVPRQLAANDVSCLAVHWTGQRRLERVTKNTGPEPSQHTSLVGSGLQSFSQNRLLGLALIQVFSAGNLREKVIIIILPAVFFFFQSRNRKLDAIRIQIRDLERFSLGIGNFKSNHGPSAGHARGDDFRLETTLGRVLSVNGRNQSAGHTTDQE